MSETPIGRSENLNCVKADPSNANAITKLTPKKLLNSIFFFTVLF